VTTNVSNSQIIVKKLTNKENVLNAAKAINSLKESVKLTTIVKNTDGSMLARNGQPLTLKDVKKSASVVRRVITSIVTTNVSNSQIIVKKLTNMENALNVVKDTNSTKESVKLTTIVKNTDGSMLARNGKRLTLKDVLKSANAVRRVSTSIVTTNVNHCHAIVKKLTLTEAANVAKKVTNSVTENASKRRKTTEDIEINKTS